MIEIFNIVILILSMIWICLFPFSENNFIYNKNLLGSSLLEKISINLGIFINILLILSFYKFNLNYVFFIFIFLPLLNIFNLNKQNKSFSFLILFFLIFVLSIHIGSNLKLEWDAQALWIYRTINFYDGNNFENLSNIPGVISYPHLGTYLWAFFWKNSLINHEYTGRIFYIFSYCLSVILIVSQTKKDNLIKLILIFIFIFFSLDFYLLSGYQEYLVFSYLIFIFYFFQKFCEKKNILFLIPAILFSNAIIWIKNEASVFLLFFIIYLFFYNFFLKKKIIKENIIFSFCILVLIFIKNYIFFNYFGEINKGWHDYNINSISIIFNTNYLLDRIPYILIHLFIATIKSKIYILFFLIIIYLLCSKKFKISKTLPYIVFYLANIALVFLIYFLTNSPDWKTYIATTADRLLFQTSGIYLLFIYDILSKDFNIKKYDKNFT